MEYCIYPPIGVARLGNSTSFFVGPEVLGSRGREIAGGNETEVTAFKDAQFRVKKQAARFRLYQRANPAEAFVPAVLPAGGSIRWSVRVANKKDAIIRPPFPPAPVQPPAQLRPMSDPARADRLIDSTKVSIQGNETSGVALQGSHAGAPVRLGELRTDSIGRLLVLGADGISRSSPPSPIGTGGGDFYNNVNWHDDIADGQVTAEVIVPGQPPANAAGAWVVIGPPDFAPGASCIVSLYDVVRQLAVDQGWLAAPTITLFTRDIYPLFLRARSLRFAHGRLVNGVVISEPLWSNISDDFARLADATAQESAFRAAQRTLLLQVEQRLLQYRLTTIQKEHLVRWRDGLFVSDWTGPPPIVANPTPASLTQAALDGAAGQGFFPGIEGGRIFTDSSIYESTSFDFRIDHAVLAPGDATALMAQPWQADFLKCRTMWWPSQRPDIAPQPDGTLKLWARLGPTESLPNHQEMVDRVMQFGSITPRNVGGIEVCVEEGRDPAAGP